MKPSWKIGFEIELMAPPGGSRLELAERVARQAGGTVRRFFHPQSEPSAVKGLATFENLTPGFEALDGEGRPLGRFVDDVTLQEGLIKTAAPRPGWYRVVADDARLLRLLIQNCDPEATLAEAMAALAALFGTEAERHASGMVRVSDDRGVSVAIGAPLPGERERPCEIVTPPLERDHEAALEKLLAAARGLGFAAPAEGATHLHFDAGRLTSAAAVANLVNALTLHGAALKKLVGTNPRCTRLGHWPEGLGALVNGADFAGLAWEEARARLAGAGLKKYCDFNLLNIASAHRTKHTFEVRILPVYLEARPAIEAAALFEAILDWCVRPGLRAVPETLDGWIDALPLDAASRALWRGRLAAP